MRRQHRRVLVGTLVAAILAAGACAGLADYEPASGASASGASSYVVQPGDTLWEIAAAHRLTVSQLAAYNGLDPAAILLVGRHLSFPGPGSSAVAGSGQTLDPAQFCSSLSVSPGPWGVLPNALAASPSQLALRPLLQHWASYYGLSAPLLEAVTWQESGWQQNVVSPAGAIGAGQLMPGTAAFIQSGLIGQSLNIWSVSDNIRMAAALLAYLAHIEGNNRCYTIAAYYEGPVNLTARGMFSDTQTYVADVEALVPRFS
jgi:LysM repeat protein